MRNYEIRANYKLLDLRFIVQEMGIHLKIFMGKVARFLYQKGNCGNASFGEN